jgi:hypothetical protein
MFDRACWVADRGKNRGFDRGYSVEESVAGTKAAGSWYSLRVSDADGVVNMAHE